MTGDRVTQTINRLISNLPQAIERLRASGLTSLPRQLQNDLDNLKHWQRVGGLKVKNKTNHEQRHLKF